MIRVGETRNVDIYKTVFYDILSLIRARGGGGGGRIIPLTFHLDPLVGITP